VEDAVAHPTAVAMQEERMAAVVVEAGQHRFHHPVARERQALLFLSTNHESTNFSKRKSLFA
jgi:hypothetical protein